ncbi:hypothetical protein QBC39DRAFT_154595 [Podospora conica]|nr:hypothetical protein QBC39DRAFT_154595 [Schizothecium conicum]
MTFPSLLCPTPFPLHPTTKSPPTAFICNCCTASLVAGILQPYHIVSTFGADADHSKPGNGQLAPVIMALETLLIKLRASPTRTAPSRRRGLGGSRPRSGPVLSLPSGLDRRGFGAGAVMKTPRGAEGMQELAATLSPKIGIVSHCCPLRPPRFFFRIYKRPCIIPPATAPPLNLHTYSQTSLGSALCHQHALGVKSQHLRVS